MTLDTSHMQCLRSQAVEAKIKAQCEANGVSQNVLAGDLMCLATGHMIRWSIQVDASPAPELFLSSRDASEYRVTDTEVRYACERLGLRPTVELDATSQHQNTLRAFHVRGIST